MSETIGEKIHAGIQKSKDKITRAEETIKCAPKDLLELEADRVSHISSGWFILHDESHPSLCSDLLGLGFRLRNPSGRKAVVGREMHAEFVFDLENWEYIFVTVARPLDKDCVHARVRITTEQEVMICGDLPDNYEVLEVLE